MLSGDAAHVAGVALEGVGDLVVGLCRQVGDDDLDTLVLGLEADERFGADEGPARDHADPRARCKNRVGGESGVCRDEGKKRGREQASDQVHENSIRLTSSRSEDRHAAAPRHRFPRSVGAAFSGFAVRATGRPGHRSRAACRASHRFRAPRVQAMFSSGAR